MKSLYSLAASLLCLAACSKEKDNTPRLSGAFNQPLTLRYAQSADLPDQQMPELTVSLEDVIDSRCPPCFSPGIVQALIAVRSQDGEQQTLKLCLGCGSATGLSDSAAVQTNNRRYVLRLHQVTPEPTSSNSTSANKNKDKQIVLTVQR